MKIGKRKIKKGELFVVSVLYLCVTVLFSVSVFFDFTHSIPGDYGDAVQNIAIIQVGADRIVENLTTGSFQSRVLYSFEFLFGLFDLTNVARALAVFVGAIPAYNTLWVFSFFASALSMYLFARMYVKNVYAAFLAGFLFSFAPYHFAYGVSFRGAIHVEFIPLFLLFFISFLKKFSLKDLLFSGIFFLFLARTEHHFAFFMILFTLPLVYYYLIRRWLVGKIVKQEKVKYFCSIFFGFIALVLPFAGYVSTALSNQNYLRVDLNELLPNSLDSLSFIVPGMHHSLWGDFFSVRVWPKIMEVPGVLRQKYFGEISGYVSFFGLSMFAFLLLQLKRFKKKSELTVWIFLCVLFYIFSLGPFLTVLGPLPISIPLPTLVLYEYFPFFDNIRAVGRFFPFAMVAFSLLVALSYILFIKRISKKYRPLFGVFAFLVLVLEFMYMPSVISLKPPAFVEFLRNDLGDYKVVNINSAYCYVCESQFRYYNSIHKKDVVGGRYFARPKPGYDFEKTTPLVKEILYDFSVARDASESVIQHDFSSFSNHLFTEEGIKYLVLDKQWMVPRTHNPVQKDAFVTPDVYTQVRNGIEDNIAVSEFWHDENFLVYEVLPPTSKKDYVLVRQPEDAKNHFKRNEGEYIDFYDQDVLEFENYSGEDLRISIDLSFYEKQDVDSFSVRLNDTVKTVLNFSQSHKTQIIVPGSIEKGELFFELEDDQFIRVDRVAYNSFDYNEYKESLSSLLDSYSLSEVYFSRSIISFVDDFGYLNDVAIDETKLGLDLISSGVVDWKRVTAARDVYTYDYYRAYLSSFIDGDIPFSYFLHSKGDRAYDDSLFGMLVENMGVFEVIEKNTDFRLFGLNDQYDTSAPFVDLNSGFGSYVLDEELTKPLELFAYREIIDSSFSFSIDNYSEGYEFGFSLKSLSVPVGGEQLKIEQGDVVSYYDLSSELDVVFLLTSNDLVNVSFVDERGDLIDLSEDSSLYIYDVFAQKK